MMSPTGIMPEELLTIGRREDAKRWLMAQPFPGDFKVSLWKGWCVVTRGKMRADEIALIEASGTD